MSNERVVRVGKRKSKKRKEAEVRERVKRRQAIKARRGEAMRGKQLTTFAGVKNAKGWIISRAAQRRVEPVHVYVRSTCRCREEEQDSSVHMQLLRAG